MHIKQICSVFALIIEHLCIQHNKNTTIIENNKKYAKNDLFDGKLKVSGKKCGK